VPKPTSRLFPFSSGAAVSRNSRGQHLTYATHEVLNDWAGRQAGRAGENGKMAECGTVAAWVAVLLLVLCSRGQFELASTAANLS
jgi:hypothetical protein